MATDIEQLTPVGVLNGESPLWDPRTGRLVWIDVRGEALHEFDPATRTDRSWAMPAWLGACYLAKKGIAVTLRTGLFDFDHDPGTLTFRAGAPFDSRRFTFNDGRCDRQGRLFAGPMLNPLPPEAADGPGGAPLWRYDGAGRWTPISQPVRTSNGLAWSPDGRVMYHSDTRTKTIWTYDYDPATGAAENRRVFATVDIKDASGPDGATVDRDGFYWSAIFGGGCLLRYDPTGKLERRVDLPCRCPTMPAFGGPGLDELYITSANHRLTEAQRAASPQEGALFRMPAPVPGLAETVFRP